MPVPSELAHHRARRAIAVRNVRRLAGPARAAAEQSAAEALQALNAAKLDRHIQAVVDLAPELSADQRDRLTALLRPDVAGAGGPDAA